MSYLGREYRFEREENFEAFLAAIDVAPEDKARIAQYKPSQKLERDGDGYRYTTVLPQRTKTITFKSGVEFDDEIKEGTSVKTTFTVDGDTVTQVIKDSKGRTATFKREYSGDKLKVSITASVWDGVAYRYYTA
ncbi:fatty acid-binding protein 1-like [Galleria mellonella]|uniref:Fatty acid-binding protein 1-like n=1 Tax=Galleria mellonella TaxID=7137 RepID=A0ABM3MKY0_GALME|nr:fatty acid-binding protein 1-like [Galleria mellonella]